MITASMTSGEMRRVRNLDETRIYEFQMRKANELKREMKRQKVRQITKTFEFATPNADYFIVVGVKHGDVFASGVFIYLKETNEYIPMSRNEGYSEDCFAMSVHFMKRFAERFLKKDLPIAKISSNPQPIGFRENLLVKRPKFFYCTYSLGITETS